MAVLLASVLAGCSLIYNPNNLPAPRMDAGIVDANPCALTLTDVAPATVLEGQGDAGSLPAVVVIHGENLVNTALQVELKAQDGSTVHLAPITDATASADHTYLAFTVTAHVDQALAANVPLDITVTQGAPPGDRCMGVATQTLSGKLTLAGLPELTTLTGTLLPLYSMVQLANVTFPAGGSPVQIAAVSSITMGTITANASGAAAGPGAYSAGGTPGPGGGGVGMAAPALGFGGGGGGAGFAAAGVAGTTAAGSGGTAGAQNGEDQIISLQKNLASAGGTGGAGLAALGGTLLLGGSGGGGGGAGGGGGGPAAPWSCARRPAP